MGSVATWWAHDTLGHWDGSAWQYPLPDALGSVPRCRRTPRTASPVD